MHQEQRIVPYDAAVPQLGLELVADDSDGYNLRIIIRQFHLEPPFDRDKPRAEPFLRGHAHLYLNGTKLTRIYGSDIHLPARLFRAGINSLQLSINDHGHAVWAIEKEPIQATLLVNPELDEFVLSHYSSSPLATH